MVHWDCMVRQQSITTNYLERGVPMRVFVAVLVLVLMLAVAGPVFAEGGGGDFSPRCSAVQPCEGGGGD